MLGFVYKDGIMLAADTLGKPCHAAAYQATGPFPSFQTLWAAQPHFASSSGACIRCNTSAHPSPIRITKLTRALCVGAGSYGSTKRYKSVDRLIRINGRTVLGASGELSDLAYILKCAYENP